MTPNLPMLRRAYRRAKAQEAEEHNIRTRPNSHRGAGTPRLHQRGMLGPYKAHLDWQMPGLVGMGPKGAIVSEALYIKIGKLLDGKPTDVVIPMLLTFSARALVEEAGGDIGVLATLLTRFYKLLENESADMLEKDGER